MTKNPENRARVQAGIPAGGQFAPETHAEPSGVTLTAERPALDQTAFGVVGALVRARSAAEMGSWLRRMDKGNGHLRPNPPVPDVLAELKRRAAVFETLPRQEQDEILEQLKMQEHSYLLEPGQRLGNDRVQVAEGLDASNPGLALVAQKVVADAGLPRTVTMVEAGERTRFTVQDGNILHNISVGPHSLSLSARPADSEDYLRGDWMARADISVAGGNVFQSQRSDSLRRDYLAHCEYAVMMGSVADSPLKDAADELGELDRSARTVELRADGAEYVLDVSGETPALIAEGGTTLHPSMVNGFLQHVAAKTGHTDGNALAEDLREVFRETDRRLVR